MSPHHPVRGAQLLKLAHHSACAMRIIIIDLLQLRRPSDIHCLEGVIGLRVPKRRRPHWEELNLPHAVVATQSRHRTVVGNVTRKRRLWFYLQVIEGRANVYCKHNCLVHTSMARLGRKAETLLFHVI